MGSQVRNGGELIFWRILSSRWGQYALIGGAIAAALGLVLLWAYGKGEAAAAAAATAAALERTAAAARARAKVVAGDREAMDNDPDNRDRGKR